MEYSKINRTNLIARNIAIEGLTSVKINKKLQFLRTSSENYTEEEDSNSFYDYSLIGLTDSERIILTVVVVILMCYSIFGNCATIYVNVTRKQRPMFRVCLLSLALSDLMITIFMSASYLSQFSRTMTKAWTLGDLLCAIIPFITTMSVLVNSMTLVGIALDRYMAVKKVIKGTWEPSGIFCGACAIFIWGLSAGIASPQMSAYILLNIIVILTDPNDHSINLDFVKVSICVGAKKENALYYGIIFSIISLPLLAAFFWLNFTIAREIYNRRNPIQSSSIFQETSQNNSNRTTTEDTSIENKKSSYGVVQSITTGGKNKQKHVPKCYNNHRDKRKSRQLRMFIVIIVIILLFLVLRLPAWIFLLIKINLELIQNYHSVLQYTFGIFSLTNCVVNPFIYTFLPETIVYGSIVTKSCGKCASIFCCFYCNHCKRNENLEEVDNSNTSSNVEQINPAERHEEDGGVYIGEEKKISQKY